jgi:hypothetical protein
MNSELPTFFLLYNYGPKKKNKKEIRKFTFSYKGKLPMSNFHERHSY